MKLLLKVVIDLELFNNLLNCMQSASRFLTQQRPQQLHQNCYTCVIN